MKGAIKQDVANNALLNNVLTSVTQDMLKQAEDIVSHWAKFEDHKKDVKINFDKQKQEMVKQSQDFICHKQNVEQILTNQTNEMKKQCKLMN